MRRTKRNRVHREVIVQAVGLVQSDRKRQGRRGAHDYRCGDDGGLAGADPPVPAISVIPEVLKMPEVP
jgi:hypothetical protein